MSQYLGDISAYALAVSQGYTGTEEEYAELMASYATVGQTAVTAAQTATTKASEAATSATTATNKASEATTAATTATNKAAEAQADADAAALDASQALSAASTATTKATEATTAAATAVSAKDDAVAANTAAQSAKTAAQTAQTGAETAAASVQSSAAQIATNTDDIAQLMSDFTQITRWSNTISDTVSYNETKLLYVYAREGDVIHVVSSVNSDKISIGLKNASDKTFVNGIRFFNGEIYIRATQDVLAVGIYNGSSETATITATVLKDILLPTNYYDKSSKVDGYIDGNGQVINNYFHSDFIPCVIGEKFVFSGYPSVFGNPQLSFYDANKIYIGRTYGITTVRDDGLYEYELTYQRAKNGLTHGDLFNIHYVVFNIAPSGSDTAVFYRNNVPDTVNAYGLYSPNANELFNASQKEYIGATSSSPINGKKIAYNGDSICESRIGDSTSSNGGAYAKLIADITNGTYDNRGRGGGTLASGTSATRQVVNDITNMPNDADLICFEGGINDYWLSVPLGDYVENDYSGTLDITTVCGALESIFRQAIQKWVGKPICFIIVHKIKSTVYVANSAGYTFAQAREKMIGICEKYAIPYYDAFADSGLNAYNDIQNNTFLTSNATGTGDGCHPNENGYKKYYVPQLIDLFNAIIPR